MLIDSVFKIDETITCIFFKKNLNTFKKFVIYITNDLEISSGDSDEELIVLMSVLRKQLKKCLF